MSARFVLARRPALRKRGGAGVWAGAYVTGAAAVGRALWGGGGASGGVPSVLEVGARA